MPIEVNLIRRRYGLMPATEHDEEEIALFPVGAKVRASITMPKSEAQHRFFRSLTSQIAKAVGKTREEVDLELRVACGMVKEVTAANGATEFTTISTTEMEHPVFNAFVEAVQSKVAELFGPEGQRVVDEAWAKLSEPGGRP